MFELVVRIGGVFIPLPNPLPKMLSCFEDPEFDKGFFEDGGVTD